MAFPLLSRLLAKEGAHVQHLLHYRRNRRSSRGAWLFGPAVIGSQWLDGKVSSKDPPAKTSTLCGLSLSDGYAPSSSSRVSVGENFAQRKNDVRR
jgi:hypothetical protein